MIAAHSLPAISDGCAYRVAFDDRHRPLAVTRMRKQPRGLFQKAIAINSTVARAAIADARLSLPALPPAQPAKGSRYERQR